MTDATATTLATALGPRAGHVVVTAPTADAAAMAVARVEPEIVASRCVWVNGREINAAQLRHALATEDDRTRGPLHVIVRALLDAARRTRRPLVVVVRDADALEAPRLEWLRLTLECAPDASDLVRLVLVGSPKLLATLRRPEARALATRVTSRIATDAETVRVPMTPPRPPRARRVVAAGMLGAALSAGVAALILAPSWLRSPPPPVAPPALTPRPSDDPTEVTIPPPVEAPPPPRAIVHPPAPRARPSARHGTRVQVGAFRSLANATALRDELEKRFAHVTVTETSRGDVTFHRVRIEGLVGDAAVNAALETLRGAGHQAIRVRD